MTFHWPSFWLGLFAPSMAVLTLLVIGGLIDDVLTWLRERREPL